MADNKGTSAAAAGLAVGAKTNAGISGAAAGVAAGYDSFSSSPTNGVTEWPSSNGPPFKPNIKQKPSTAKHISTSAVGDSAVAAGVTGGVDTGTLGGLSKVSKTANVAINSTRLTAEIQPYDHFRDGREPLPTNTPVRSMKFYTNSTQEHFITDYRQNISSGKVDSEVDYVRDARMGDNNHSAKSSNAAYNTGDSAVAAGLAAGTLGITDTPRFSASVTDVNQFNDPVTEDIINSGTLSNYLEDTNKEKEIGDYDMPPTSPLHPFTRMNSIKQPHVASKTIFTAYNRTKLPIADVAWRKGFRHIFITRPECYLWYNDENGSGICDQAYNDPDFQSAFTRMPHIIKLLSPYYVSGSYPKSDSFSSNWNFLLSNTVQGMSVSELGMSITDNVTKSIEGYTVTPAGLLEGRQGASLDLSFKDTNNLEVFEFLRLWELYEYKRKKGVFSPPFNGYKKTNGFINMSGAQPKAMSDREYWTYHPYDRALEYCASLYDIITNESGTKILYWCKYYGIYPTKVNPSLNNENNTAITDMTVTASFKYHYKLENANSTLIEFNHDAGIVDHTGKLITSNISNSDPFLLKQGQPDLVLPNYIGASGMFTGSPYIIIARSRPDPLEPDKNVISVPNLRFMGINDSTVNGYANLKIETPAVPGGITTTQTAIVSYSE